MGMQSILSFFPFKKEVEEKNCGLYEKKRHQQQHQQQNNKRLKEFM